MIVRRLNFSVANEYGIDNIKLMLIFLFTSINQLIMLIANFNFLSAFAVIQEVYSNRALFTPENLKIIFQELREIDPAEGADLQLFFAEEFDIADDSLEEKIEEGVALLAEYYEKIVGIIKLYNRTVDWYNGFGEAKVVSMKFQVKQLPDTLFAQAA